MLFALFEITECRIWETTDYIYRLIFDNLRPFTHSGFQRIHYVQILLLSGYVEGAFFRFVNFQFFRCNLSFVKKCQMCLHTKTFFMFPACWSSHSRAQGFHRPRNRTFFNQHKNKLTLFNSPSARRDTMFESETSWVVKRNKNAVDIFFYRWFGILGAYFKWKLKIAFIAKSLKWSS